MADILINDTGFTLNLDQGVPILSIEEGNRALSVVIMQEKIIPQVISDEEINVEIVEDPIIVEISAAPGEKGDPGSGATVDKVAGEILSGQRVVIVDTNELIYYADKDTISHSNKVLGITKSAGVIGGSIEVQYASEFQDPSFSFDMTKPIYLGNNGLLTQVYPTTGFVLYVGFPVATDTIMIAIKIPIILI